MVRQPSFFIILSLVTFFINCSKVTGQEYSWMHYSVSQGLPQSQIFNFYQDSKGYLWICTKGGLSRFDGIEFENYSIKDGLDADFVIYLYEDSSGVFYIGTRYGVNILKDGKLSSIPIFKGQYLTGMQIDSQNGLWVQGGNKDLLNVVDGKKVVDHPVYNFLNEGEKLYLGGSRRSLGKLLFNTSEKRTFSWNGKSISLIEKRRQNLIPSLGNDGKLYGITSDSIFVYEKKVFNPIVYIKGFNVKYINSGDDIYLVDQGSQSYISHYDGKNITKYHKKFSHITTIFADDESNLWVGTEAGVWRLITKGFQNYLANSGDNFYTWTVLQDNNDNYWFGSFLYGLKKFDGLDFTDYPVDHLFKFGGFQYFYSGGIKAKNGDLLFSAYRGVIKYDGNKFDWYYYGKRETIVYIHEDRENDKLYFSSARNGIIEIDQNKKIKYLDGRGKKENTGLVTSILKDKYERLWISGNLGISIQEDGNWRNLPDDKDSVDIGAICMLKDFRGNLWLGSNDGLYYYNYNKLRRIGAEIIDGQVGVLNIAKSGELLIGSIKGIGLLNLEKFYTSDEESVRFFNNQNGFLGTDIKHNSSSKDNDENSWICRSDRVVKIDTDELLSNPNPPRVYIKSVSTMSDNMEWKSALNMINNNDTCSFGPLENDIRFDYHGISLSAPTGVVYQTMLKGYDNGWSAISKERYRTYTNLPQGNYTFKIKAANYDGIWTDTIASINLIIKPAWHELLSVKLGGLAVVIFLAAGIGYLFSDNKKRKLANTQQNEKRIAKIQFNALKGLIDPHFTFNAINSIATMVYKENRDEAYHYFTKFSKLIRTAFENSDRTTRTIKEELSFVTDYLDIEIMRFKDRFIYSIDMDKKINTDWYIPKMIIQIYVENAIKHGLLPLQNGGNLEISLKLKNENLVIEIMDNGVGRKISGLEKNKDTSLGRGTKIFDSYFELLNKFNTDKINVNIIDIEDEVGNANGTRVIINIPLNFKFNL